MNASPHVLGDVATCKTRGWVRHVAGYTSKGESLKLLAGTAIHKGIATYLAGDAGATAWTDYAYSALTAFHVAYDLKWAELSADVMEPAYTPDNLHRVLARWIETHPPGALPWRRVLAVEEAFASRTFNVAGGEVRFIVRPDVLVETYDGRVAWADVKTTGWRIGDPSWKGQFKTSAQCSAYTDAVRSKYGARAMLGGWVIAMEIRQLPSDPTRTCATHKVKYAECGGEHANAEIIEVMRGEEMLEQWAHDTRMAAFDFAVLQGRESVDGLPMDGALRDACRYCFALPWCDAGRPVAALDSFFVYSPWEVSEGVRACA